MERERRRGGEASDSHQQRQESSNSHLLVSAHEKSSQGENNSIALPNTDAQHHLQSEPQATARPESMLHRSSMIVGALVDPLHSQNTAARITRRKTAGPGSIVQQLSNANHLPVDMHNGSATTTTTTTSHSSARADTTTASNTTFSGEHTSNQRTDATQHIEISGALRDGEGSNTTRPETTVGEVSVQSIDDMDVQPLEDRRWLILLFQRDYNELRKMLSYTPGLVATMEFFTGSNSLHYAARLCDETLLHLLLSGDYSVAVQQKNYEGNTPLHVAYAHNTDGRCEGIIERLIMIGADEDVRNFNGLVPRDMTEAAAAATKRLPMCVIDKVERPDDKITIITKSKPDSALPAHGSQHQKPSKSILSFFRTPKHPKAARKEVVELADATVSPKGALMSPPPGISPFKFNNKNGEDRLTIHRSSTISYGSTSSSSSSTTTGTIKPSKKKTKSKPRRFTISKASITRSDF